MLGDGVVKGHNRGNSPPQWERRIDRRKPEDVERPRRCCAREREHVGDAAVTVGNGGVGYSRGRSHPNDFDVRPDHLFDGLAIDKEHQSVVAPLVQHCAELTPGEAPEPALVPPRCRVHADRQRHWLTPFDRPIRAPANSPAAHAACWSSSQPKVRIERSSPGLAWRKVLAVRTAGRRTAFAAVTARRSGPDAVRLAVMRPWSNRVFSRAPSANGRANVTVIPGDQAIRPPLSFRRRSTALSTSPSEPRIASSSASRRKAKLQPGSVETSPAAWRSLKRPYSDRVSARVCAGRSSAIITGPPQATTSFPPSESATARAQPLSGTTVSSIKATSGVVANSTALRRLAGISGRSAIPTGRPLGSTMVPSRRTARQLADCKRTARRHSSSAFPPMSATTMMVTSSGIARQCDEPVASFRYRDRLLRRDRRRNAPRTLHRSIKFADERLQARISDLAAGGARGEVPAGSCKAKAAPQERLDDLRPARDRSWPGDGEIMEVVELHRAGVRRDTGHEARRPATHAELDD